MENQVTKFLTIERDALIGQIEKLTLKVQYIDDLLSFAKQVSNPKVLVTAKDNTFVPLSGKTIYEDVVGLLKLYPEKEFGALELIDALKSKWENSSTIKDGKQSFRKRVWGTMNYLRKTKKENIVVIRRGNRSYLKWI